MTDLRLGTTTSTGGEPSTGLGPIDSPCATRRLRAMGTDVEIVVVGPAADRLAHDAVDRLARLEQMWSRFLPNSDVSRLNRAGGAPVTVDGDTVRLVRAAVEAWTESGGFVDCTGLADVIANGYDRSFDEIPADRSASAPSSAASAARSPLGSGPVEIEVDGLMVTVPADVQFDPGGIGKGLAADLIADELAAAGAEACCVNLGGDLRVVGDAPGGAGWTVAIEHRDATDPLSLVGVRNGAVATSTTLLRRWNVDGVARHHLIDPRTGRSSDSGIALVSVIAERAVVAEALAKTVLIRGGAHPFDPVDRPGVEALIAFDDGRLAWTDGWLRYSGGVTPVLVGAAPASADPERSTPRKDPS